MKNPKHKYLLFIIDWLIILYAYFLSLWLQVNWRNATVIPTVSIVITELLYFIPYSLVILFIFTVNRFYQIDIYLSGTRQFQAILKAEIFSITGLVLLSFFTSLGKSFDPRIVIFNYFVISSILLVAVRILIFRTAFKHNFFKFIPLRKTLILGVNSIGIDIANQINGHHRLGMELVGFLDNNVNGGVDPLPGYPVIGKISDYATHVEKKNIDELILCSEDLPDDKLFKLVEDCAATKARVMIGSKQFTVISRYVPEEFYGNVPLVGALNSFRYLGWHKLKRMMDIILASLGMVILSPLFSLVAVGIKLDSCGPIFYRQTRIGKNGKPFTFYKFRSMKVGSDSDETRPEKLRKFIKEGKCDNHDNTKIVDDSKVTRMGKLIRKTSVDELPQLINVIRGDMSLVGPRPCLPYEWENYDPWHRKRLSVTPGCTGLWQVSARSEVGFREMVLLDLYYIYNTSLHLDIWLILKTVPVMLFGKGGK